MHNELFIESVDIMIYDQGFHNDFCLGLYDDTPNQACKGVMGIWLLHNSQQQPWTNVVVKLHATDPVAKVDISVSLQTFISRAKDFML